MPNQEMLQEIKRVLELTLRVDERVKAVCDSHEKMAERFDKFLEQHTALTERVIKMETNIWNSNKIIDRFEEIELENNKISNRIAVAEKNAPYTLKIVDQALIALNKLADRIAKIESEQNEQGKKVKTWNGWIESFGEWCFKIAWIVIAAYILTRLGLGGVSIPSPF